MQLYSKFFVVFLRKMLLKEKKTVARNYWI